MDRALLIGALQHLDSLFHLRINPHQYRAVMHKNTILLRTVSSNAISNATKDSSQWVNF